jgi:hypothetical protein
MSLAVGFDDGVMTGAIPWERLASASTTLYRDGKLVRTEPGPGGFFQVPGEAADYRLLSDIEVVGGSHTTTNWRFRSAADTDPNLGGAVPPLLSVDYAPSTNQLGVAAAGHRLDFDLRLAHLPGADATEQIDALTLAWSSTGNAWKAATIRRTGPMSFAASIKGKDLVGGSTVSLRLTARDADGNAMEQTIRGFIPIR